MFRPPKELTSAPGIRYLEYYGLRMVRSYMMVKIMTIFMGSIPIVIAIIFSSIDLFSTFPYGYYIFGGAGGLFLLIGIILFFVLPGRRHYNRILRLRDSGAVNELKEILYKPGAKSTIAMFALIDLGEVSPDMFLRMRMGYGNQQSLDGF